MFKKLTKFNFSAIRTTVNFVKGMVGPGTLFVPLAFKQGGLVKVFIFCIMNIELYLDRFAHCVHIRLLEHSLYAQNCALFAVFFKEVIFYPIIFVRECVI